MLFIKKQINTKDFKNLCNLIAKVEIEHIKFGAKQGYDEDTDPLAVKLMGVKPIVDKILDIFGCAPEDIEN